MVHKGKLVSEESCNAIAIYSIDVQIQTDLNPLKKTGCFEASHVIGRRAALTFGSVTVIVEGKLLSNEMKRTSKRQLEKWYPHQTISKANHKARFNNRVDV